MKAKHQRLTLVLLACLAVLAAVLLGMQGLKEDAAFFYAPADVAKNGVPPANRNVRIGGMVRGGSIARHPDGVTIDFVVGDETAAVIPVRFTGIAPDLFKENSGVVAEGRFQPNGQFVASEILAKHDENYMPPELARNGAEHKTESLQ